MSVPRIEVMGSGMSADGLCLTASDGQRLFEAIVAELDRADAVCVDFSDVEVVASPYLNSAFGQLMSDWTPDEFSEHVIVENLADIWHPLIEVVITGSYRYRTDPEFAERLDAILLEDDDEE